VSPKRQEREQGGEGTAAPSPFLVPLSPTPFPQIPLPPRIDPTVTMMQVEEKPDVTYDDVGGAGDALEKLREVVEMPLLHPERFVALGIDPPKGVLLYGPPGTGKTLSARAVANRTDACFIRVIGSELIQKYVGEGARMVRELFQLARSKKACIIFFDEVDAIGERRRDDGERRQMERGKGYPDDSHPTPFPPLSPSPFPQAARASTRAAAATARCSGRCSRS
jgi:hypothetical protein